jgi:hypothetical protein
MILSLDSVLLGGIFGLAWDGVIDREIEGDLTIPKIRQKCQFKRTNNFSSNKDYPLSIFPISRNYIFPNRFEIWKSNSYTSAHFISFFCKFINILLKWTRKGAQGAISFRFFLVFFLFRCF